MKLRDSMPPRDIHKDNIEKLQSMSKGKPPRERLPVPPDADVYCYASQKLNIWEL